MTKKAGKFAAVYNKSAPKERRREGVPVHVEKSPEGWAQKEVDYLVENAPSPDQKVSYDHSKNASKVDVAKEKAIAEKKKK